MLFEHGFCFKKPKLGPDLHASMLSFAKTLRAFIRCCSDVMTFESLTLTPFCFEKSSVKKGIFNV